MSRRSLFLWAAALVVAPAPALFSWMSGLLGWGGGERSFLWMSSGWCTGYAINDEIRGLLAPVRALPLLWFGSAPLVGAAFAGWWLSIRVPDGTVQLLIMVFPGKEQKPVIHR
ncbi:hypothetical protein ACFOWE_02885 [Planomonospora corallina]|uniref:Uncharacterized protein n=1 Tax=Planomonospora corallina TaxID=1806052 RepID=A0ABV8I2E9_9ACTN